MKHVLGALVPFIALTTVGDLLSPSSGGSAVFSLSSGTLVTEIVRLVASALGSLGFGNRQDRDTSEPCSRKKALRSPKSWFLCFGPGFCRIIQGFINYVAARLFITKLFLAVCTSEVLFTALWSSALVGVRFSRGAVVYLLLLTAGAAVAITSAGAHGVAAIGDDTTAAADAAAANDDPRDGAPSWSRALMRAGPALALSGAALAGLAAAHTQKLLKVTFNDAWEGSVALAFTSAVMWSLCLISVAPPGQPIAGMGIFDGWTRRRWAVVSVRACEGVASAFAIRAAGSVAVCVTATVCVILPRVVPAAAAAFTAAAADGPRERFDIAPLLATLAVTCGAFGFLRSQVCPPRTSAVATAAAAGSCSAVDLGSVRGDGPSCRDPGRGFGAVELTGGGGGGGDGACSDSGNSESDIEKAREHDSLLMRGGGAHAVAPADLAAVSAAAEGTGAAAKARKGKKARSLSGGDCDNEKACEGDVLLVRKGRPAATSAAKPAGAAGPPTRGASAQAVTAAAALAAPAAAMAAITTTAAAAVAMAARVAAPGPTALPAPETVEAAPRYGHTGRWWGAVNVLLAYAPLREVGK
ncbi:unnamed protein product [Phaeothamnion confervicola]